jgi:hypothetical protein
MLPAACAATVAATTAPARDACLMCTMQGSGRSLYVRNMFLYNNDADPGGQYNLLLTHATVLSTGITSNVT